MAKYHISGGSDQYWTVVNARTLTAAKCAASKMYQQTVGGKIEVGQECGSGNSARVEKVAVKYGYNKWQSA